MELAPRVVRPARAEDPGSEEAALTRYFREITVGPGPLGAAAERRLGHILEDADRQVWAALLAHPPVARSLVGRVLDALPGVAPAVAGIEAALRRAPLRRAEVARAAQAVAPSLHAADRDRVLLRQLVAEAERLCARPSPGTARWLLGLRADLARADAARQELVRRNLRLVVAVARRYRHRGLALADLIQEGNLGLLKAVDRYEPGRGFRFSTYASWWIRDAVRRGLDERGRLVRQPSYRIAARARLARAQGHLLARLGRTPTIAELAAATDLPPGRVEKVLRPAFDRALSLDQPLAGSEERPLHEVLTDPEAASTSPADLLEQRARHDQVREAVARLRPLEADVVRKRFGIDDDDGVQRTLEELGKEHHLSRERIRQIERAALRKLRVAVERADA